MTAVSNLLRAYADVVDLVDDDPFDWNIRHKYKKLRVSHDTLDWSFTITMMLKPEWDDGDDTLVDGQFIINPERVDTIEQTWYDMATDCDDLDVCEFDAKAFVDQFYDCIISVIDDECDTIKQEDLQTRRGFHGMVARNRPDLET